MAVVEKKSTARQRRHAHAIREYELWLAEHPRAKLERRIKQFDLLVDTAELLDEMRDAKNKN